jgi:hypothetical protein
LSPAEKGDGLCCRIGRGQAPTLHNIFVGFTLSLNKTVGRYEKACFASLSVFLS